MSLPPSNHENCRFWSTQNQVIYHWKPSKNVGFGGVTTILKPGSLLSTDRWSNDVGPSMPDMDMSHRSLHSGKKPSKAPNMEGRGNGTIGNIWEFPKMVVPPKSSILIGFPIINHPFGGAHPYFRKPPYGESFQDFFFLYPQQLWLYQLYRKSPRVWGCETPFQVA